MARPPKRAQPWTRASPKHAQDPYPIVREQLRAHNDLEVTHTRRVSILPVTPHRSVLLVHQYRHVWGRYSLNFRGASPSQKPPNMLPGANCSRKWGPGPRIRPRPVL